jgi:UDP-N-acetylmuramoylalanine-D-glutamate ligase
VPSRQPNSQRSGDAVVLSPAASSFDLYRDYHERGQIGSKPPFRALPEA